MPRISIIPEDNVVAIDGVGLILPPLPPSGSSWRALQWDGKQGVIEKNGGAPETFTDFRRIEPFFLAYNQEAQKYIEAGVKPGHALPPAPPPAPPVPASPPTIAAPVLGLPLAGASATIPGARRF